MAYADACNGKDGASDRMLAPPPPPLLPPARVPLPLPRNRLLTGLDLLTIGPGADALSGRADDTFGVAVLRTGAFGVGALGVGAFGAERGAETATK